MVFFLRLELFGIFHGLLLHVAPVQRVGDDGSPPAQAVSLFIMFHGHLVVFGFVQQTDVLAVDGVGLLPASVQVVFGHLQSLGISAGELEIGFQSLSFVLLCEGGLPIAVGIKVGTVFERRVCFRKFGKGPRHHGIGLPVQHAFVLLLCLGSAVGVEHRQGGAA